MKALTRTLAAGLISIVTLLSCSTPALAATTPVFDDVPETHWAHSYISQAASNGWIAGYGGGLFGPTNNVTYAALSQMLTRAFFAEKLEAVETAEGDPWFKAACTVANDLGLYVGVDIRTQHNSQEVVSQPVSRYEMAQILANAMRATGANISPNLSAAASSTADWESIPRRYQGAVAAAKVAGLLVGTDELGTFAGDMLMNRAQAATIMVRLNDLVQKGFPELGAPVDTIEPLPPLPQIVTPPAETLTPDDGAIVATGEAGLTDPT